MAKQVVVYTTPICPWCTKAKKYLDSINVPYAEYNVAQDSDKYMEMVSRSGQTGVPVITIGDDVVIGFDKAKLDSLLTEE